MNRRAMRLAVTCGVTFALAACQSWGNSRSLDALPEQPAERDRYELWAAGQPHELHALKMDGDTIRGVPWWKDPKCDSCQVAIARVSVDSVRVRTFDGGETGILVSLLILISIPVMFVIGMSGDNS